MAIAMSTLRTELTQPNNIIIVKEFVFGGSIHAKMK